jgi:hypothetical protein
MTNDLFFHCRRCGFVSPERLGLMGARAFLRAGGSLEQMEVGR